MKTCTRCGTVKPKSEFPYHETTRDNLASWCRSCKAEAVKRSKQKRRHQCYIPGLSLEKQFAGILSFTRSKKGRLLVLSRVCRMLYASNYQPHTGKRGNGKLNYWLDFLKKEYGQTTGTNSKENK